MKAKKKEIHEVFDKYWQRKRTFILHEIQITIELIEVCFH